MYPDVFLSFRGEDVRKNFLSHLYRELSGKGIRAFMNEEEEEEEKEMIERGKQTSLLHIQESKVVVVLFSKNYASSNWCLDELVKIMCLARKKSTAVVPVYYEVDSSEVRHQRGRFGEGFERHGQVEIPETLQRWRDALIKVTNKPGFSTRDSEDDSNLIRQITRHVSSFLTKSRLHKKLLPGKESGENSTGKKTSLNRLVAMDRHMVVIYGVLELKSTSEKRVIGVSGAAGIGKTCIARFIHQELSPAFQSHCFLENPSNILDHIPGNIYIQDQHTSRNIHDQERVIAASSSSGSRKELLSPRGLKRKASHTSSDLGSVDKRARFWHQRALVIVDNVETIKQLEEIIKDVNWLGSGSRVIITTQDKSLLLACGVEHVYEVDGLKYDEALELFSECAFKKQYPPANFEHLSFRAVQLTGCLPLGLKLLGSFLCGRTEEEWESELQRLEARQDKAIVELVKISAQCISHGRTKEDRECEEQRLETKQDKAIVELLKLTPQGVPHYQD